MKRNRQLRFQKPADTLAPHMPELCKAIQEHKDAHANDEDAYGNDGDAREISRPQRDFADMPPGVSNDEGGPVNRLSKN